MEYTKKKNILKSLRIVFSGAIYMYLYKQRTIVNHGSLILCNQLVQQRVTREQESRVQENLHKLMAVSSTTKKEQKRRTFMMMLSRNPQVCKNCNAENYSSRQLIKLQPLLGDMYMTDNHRSQGTIKVCVCVGGGGGFRGLPMHPLP